MHRQRSSFDAREADDGLTASLGRVAGRQNRCDLRRDVPAGWLGCADLLGGTRDRRGGLLRFYLGLFRRLLRLLLDLLVRFMGTGRHPEQRRAEREAGE